MPTTPARRSGTARVRFIPLTAGFPDSDQAVSTRRHLHTHKHSRANEKTSPLLRSRLNLSAQQSRARRKALHSSTDRRSVQRPAHIRLPVAAMVEQCTLNCPHNGSRGYRAHLEGRSFLKHRGDWFGSRHAITGGTRRYKSGPASSPRPNRYRRVQRPTRQGRAASEESTCRAATVRPRSRPTRLHRPY